ncbi:hypothetical protein FRX31_029164 [Thalictrum thalictroides]|uniref:Uncharacterized protein n=1 Tax=Thalictrum thalictroides TaxID=46969 RepID=A0A7J6V998_THATH|nr:hypothetical protein FRX31_029164 [Thalictrum thalictroides]
MGDYNAIMSVDEKVGGRAATAYDIADLLHCLMNEGGSGSAGILNCVQCKTSRWDCSILLWK